MRVAVHNHQGKANGLLDALQTHGHMITGTSPHLLLIDHDGPRYYQQIIDRAALAEIPVWLYSHGAMSCMAWDGFYEGHPATCGYLANGRGQKEIMQAYGYPKEVHVIGWHWCEVVKFTPVHNPRKVLFAPIHPLNNGFIRPEAKRDNARAFRKLANMMDIDLTVRHVGRLDANGIEYDDRVRYEEAKPHNMLESIDAADLVVSWGTFAHLAAARGKPVVMYSQDDPPGDGHSAEGMRYAQNFNKYAHLLRYPHDLFEKDPRDVLTEAGRGGAAADDWRQRFIGAPMNPAKFCQLLEGFVRA